MEKQEWENILLDLKINAVKRDSFSEKGKQVLEKLKDLAEHPLSEKKFFNVKIIYEQ